MSGNSKRHSNSTENSHIENRKQRKLDMEVAPEYTNESDFPVEGVPNEGETEIVPTYDQDKQDTLDIASGQNESNPRFQENYEGYTSFSEYLRELGQESKMVILQYSQTFADSEAFEQQACQNVVDLKGHAEILEQHVQNTKKYFCDHLKRLVQGLSVAEEDL